jgi:hypothetical protein
VNEVYEHDHIMEACPIEIKGRKMGIGDGDVVYI